MDGRFLGTQSHVEVFENKFSRNKEVFMPPRKEPQTHSAEDVRQGEIVLKRRWQRAVFIAGLAGIVLLVLFLAVAS